MADGYARPLRLCQASFGVCGFCLGEGGGGELGRSVDGAALTVNARAWRECPDLVVWLLVWQPVVVVVFAGRGDRSPDVDGFVEQLNVDRRLSQHGAENRTLAGRVRRVTKTNSRFPEQAPVTDTLAERRDICDPRHRCNGCASDILAFMQANDVAVSTDREALSRDMAALANFLMRTANMGTFNTIAELDLSFTQIKALCALDADGEEPSVKALAESLGVSLAAMSRAVDGLFERGLVHREEDAADRRMKRVGLTDAGRTVPQALNEARLSALQGLMSSLVDEEAQALAHALDLILERRDDIAAYRPINK
jgi:DNA-binding MarR family transcriptional regulator